MTPKSVADGASVAAWPERARAASPAPVPMPRSLLFMPLPRAERYLAHLAQAAVLPQAVILDLEDSVVEAAKPAARAALPHALALARDLLPGSVGLWVRVNDVRSGLLPADLDALAPFLAQGIGVMLAKCEQAGDCEAVLAAGADPARLLPLLETLPALAAAEPLLAALARLGLRAAAFGAGDMTLALGVARDYRLPIVQQVIVRLVLAARLAGLQLIDAPARIIPRPGLAPALEAAFLAECRFARDNGLWGKLAVHPAQLPALHAAFDDQAERQHAAQVLRDFAARTDGSRAVASSHDGSYLGTPSWKAAQALQPDVPPPDTTTP